MILSIGDELVLGQTVDTNSAWLSRQLAAIGWGVSTHVTVGDDQPAIEAAIREALPRCDALLISGGLGPTADDLTRQALAAVMQAPLELNELWASQIEAFFRARGRAMPATNRIQAMIPRGAEMIFNTCGTAAGIHAQLASGRARPTDVFIMPGVPKEMFAMFARDVLPALRDRGNGAVILSRTLHTFGLGESSVAEMLGDLMQRGRNPSVGTTVSAGIVSLRINARFASADEARAQVERTEADCRRALGDLIYGADDQTLAQVVGAMLRERSDTVTTAESCTGGLLGKYLTDIPGSSTYYRRGWITYCNEAKQELLGVKPQTLAAHGAVSEPTVREMAAGALARAGADYALTISGIAGPDGGSAQKPVGTVCIALAHEPAASGASCCPLTEVTARTFNFPGDREMIRDRAAKMAMAMLRYRMLEVKAPF